MFLPFFVWFLVFAVSEYQRHHGVAAHRSDVISKLRSRKVRLTEQIPAVPSSQTTWLGVIEQAFRLTTVYLLTLLLPPLSKGCITQIQKVLRKRQTIFLALQIIGGHIGIFLVLVLAVFSRRYCVFVVLSKVYRLYRGTSENTSLQPLGYWREDLCLAQAALTNGAHVMTASSMLSLVIRLWLDLRAAICGETKEPKQNQRITVLGNSRPSCVWGNPGNITYHGGTRSAYVSVLRSLSHRTLVFEPSNLFISEPDSPSVSFNFSVLADMMQAAIPLLGTIILGTRSDILGAVVLWRRNDAVKA
ncbi:hypothetical protein BU17DRAFT_63347 [Hysterangium stoloniferum]|nr:hypothetical protein BU17DRAFT_63347 [Hysterangium stoloniferum]